MSAIWEVKFRFTCVDQGWAEIYYLSTASETPGSADDRIGIMAQARRQCLSSNVLLKQISRKKVNKFKSGHTFSRGLNAGPGLLTAQCHNLTNFVQLTLYSPDFRCRRNLFLRGVPDTWATWSGTVKADVEVPSVVSSGTSKLVAAFGAVPLTSAGDGSDFGWRIRSHAVGADESPITKTPIAGVNISGAEGYLALLLPDSFGAGKGQAVKLHGLAGCILKGGSGRTTIMYELTGVPWNAAPTGFGWWQVRHRVCCSDTPSYNGKASIYAVPDSYLRTAFFALQKVGTRRVGAVHPSRSGRGRTSCCG